MMYLRAAIFAVSVNFLIALPSLIGLLVLWIK